MFVEPPFEIDSIVPKKEVFSVPQFGQGPYRNQMSVIRSNQIQPSSYHISKTIPLKSQSLLQWHWLVSELSTQ